MKEYDTDYIAFEVICPEISETIQNIAFDKGWSWEKNGNPITQHKDKKWLCFPNQRNFKRIMYNNTSTEVHTDGYHTIVNLKELMEFLDRDKSIKVSINSAYNATYNKGDSHVTIGCQQVSTDAVEELNNAIIELNKGE